MGKKAKSQYIVRAWEWAEHDPLKPDFYQEFGCKKLALKALAENARKFPGSWAVLTQRVGGKEAIVYLAVSDEVNEPRTKAEYAARHGGIDQTQVD